MKNGNRMKLKAKLLVLFMIVGLVPLAVVGVLSSTLATNALMKIADSRRMIFKYQISNSGGKL